MAAFDSKHVEFEQVLGDIANKLGIPGNLELTRTLLKLQARINTLESSERLLQERVLVLEAKADPGSAAAAEFFGIKL